MLRHLHRLHVPTPSPTFLPHFSSPLLPLFSRTFSSSTPTTTTTTTTKSTRSVSHADATASPQTSSFPARRRRFRDRIRVNVAAGRGGDGCASFARHQRTGRKNIADGGNGAPGGDVVLRAVDSLNGFTFSTFSFKAEDGSHGGASRKSGKRGRDTIVHVPVGTVVHEVIVDEVTEERSTHTLADLGEDGQTMVAAKGGAGGLGNRAFATSFSRQTVMSTFGKTGQKRLLELELKTIADVGLVGFPNAGKSSLLSAISKASPKVAAYPFTTLHPTVGTVEVNDRALSRLTVADIPGLIEGAHENRGLGHAFLRHIERTRALLYVIDVPGTEGRDPVQDFEVLRREVSMYSRELALRPAAIVANKIDRKPVTSRKNIERLREVSQLPVVAASVLKKRHLDEVVSMCQMLTTG